MEYKLQDLIDIPLLQTLQDNLNRIYEFPSAIFDMEGNILTATAWQDICVKVHRVNEISRVECLKSDRFIQDQLSEATPSVAYYCPHGLVDCATPIVIGGKQLGSFFTGQFFLEKPDPEFFKEQAGKFGYDEKAYLEALSKVPVWPQERLDKYLAVIKTVTEILAELGYKAILAIEARRAVEENEKTLSAITSSVKDAIIMINDEGTITFWNEAAMEILGYTAAEINGKNLHELIVPGKYLEDHRKAFSHFRKTGEGNAIGKTLELVAKHKEKGEFPVELSLSSVFINGKWSAVGVLRDISSRKNAELALKESEDKYKTAFKTSPDALSITRSDGIFIDVNDGFTKLSGYTRDELIGHSSVDIKLWADPDDRRKVMEDLRDHGVVNNFESNIRARNDAILPALFSASMITINNELHILSIIRDISGRKAIENELIVTKEKAEESSRLKSSLLMNMSHELRTPLNGILGFAGLLRESVTNPEEKNMTDIIMLSGKRLMATLNSIMELAQVEADNKQMEIELLDLGNAAREVLQKNQVMFEHKRIELLTVIDPGIFANLDKALFSNIVYHLVDNAVKFTDTGNVSVIVKKEIIGEEAWAVLKIRDTGKGISEQQLGYIFEAFRQGHEGIGRSHEGTGMGLTLCRKFTRIMDGIIDVESIVGVGSTFIVRFPLARETREPIVSPVPEQSGPEVDDPLIRHRILIVEDNKTNAELVAIYLKDWFSTDLAYSGTQAVKMAYLNDYDIILMDINLGPDMDGIKAAHEIRGIEQYAVKPIIAVTGYSTWDEKKFILDQGFTEFLTKPFEKEELLRVIKKVTRKS
jgi:PAS domain S-box-containing protein